MFDDVIEMSDEEYAKVKAKVKAKLEAKAMRQKEIMKFSSIEELINHHENGRPFQAS